MRNLVLGLVVLGSGLLGCNPSKGTGSGSGSGSGGSSSGIVRTVTASGGSVDTLTFAVVGDCRPGNEGDTANYPTPIITKIFQDIDQTHAQFVVSTGDYQYANPQRADGQAQLSLYAQAAMGFSGVQFPAIGNHECDGYTADNCDSSGNIVTGGHGLSNNFTAFVSTLLAPIHQTLPYYSININDTHGQWTSKFVFVAANAWDSTQQTWLTTTMATPTTYTFVVRHEPSYDNTGNSAPGVNPSDSILAASTYTLKIVGHSHVFSWDPSNREVVIGNGGAPLDSPSDTYGYGLFSLTDGGDVQVQQIDYSTNAPLRTYTASK